MELAFNGSAYHGWQRQPNSATVQAVLEEQLEEFLGEPLPVMGCGRTDTGVHASFFVAHCDWPTATARSKRYTSWEEVVWKLNGMLPPDISVQRIVPVMETAHARFSASERGYTYWMHLRKDPFLEGCSTRVYRRTDFEKMKAACAFLVQKGDFASFCKTGTDQGTTICDVRLAQLGIINSNQWKFEIRADRFLRNMVRAVVGTLLEIGQGRMDPEAMPEIIAAKNRSAAGKSAAAPGLFLSEVIYPASIWDNDSGDGLPSA